MNRMLVFIAAGATAGLAAAVPYGAMAAPAVTTAPATDKALANPNVVTVRNITRSELEPGLPIVQDGGKTMGVVARLAGSDVILDDGKHEYRLPVDQIFAYAQDGVDRFASRTPKSKLRGTPRLDPSAPLPTLAAKPAEDEEPDSD